MSAASTRRRCQVLQTLDYEGKTSDSPTEMLNPTNASQTFIDRWRNQTQIMYVAKAIVGAITPGLAWNSRCRNFNLQRLN